MIRPRLRLPRLGASLGVQSATNAAARRSYHNVPKLRHEFSETGVPNLMSPAGFSIAWSDYMTLVTEKLNALTAGKATLDHSLRCSRRKRKGVQPLTQ